MIARIASLSLAPLALVAGSAFAELPAAVGTTLTAVQTDATSLVDLVWPVVLTIAGAFVLIKLAKRGIAKI